MFGFDIFVLSVFVLIVLLILSAVKIVPQGYN